MRKMLHLEAAEESTTLIHYLMGIATNKHLFVKYCGREVRVMITLDNEVKKKGATKCILNWIWQVWLIQQKTHQLSLENANQWSARHSTPGQRGVILHNV